MFIKLCVILSLSLLSSATPDCFDFSVTTHLSEYFDFLPKLLFYGNVDWMRLQPGKNCGFYTYGDVFFQSNH